MTARISSVGRTEIAYPLWLAFREDGSVRMTRTQPAVDRNERAMALTLKVPRALFATPQLTATISIADPQQPPPVIDITAAAEALRQVVGCDVEITVATPGGGA